MFQSKIVMEGKKWRRNTFHATFETTKRVWLKINFIKSCKQKFLLQRTEVSYYPTIVLRPS